MVPIVPDVLRASYMNLLARPAPGTRSTVQRFKRSMTDLLKVPIGPNVPMVPDVQAKRTTEPIWVLNDWNYSNAGTIGTLQLPTLNV